jgi:hypothetical protein
VPRAEGKRAAAWAKPASAQGGSLALGADIFAGIEPVWS